MCRYVTGGIGEAFVSLAQPPNKLEGLVKNEASNLIGRYFCGTYGAHRFANVYEADTCSADSGIIEEAEPGAGHKGKDIVKITRHAFIGDTGDWWNGWMAP